MSRVAVFGKTEQQTVRWLEDVATGMGSTDMQRSHKVFRAVLHATRDRLMLDELRELWSDPGTSIAS